MENKEREEKEGRFSQVVEPTVRFKVNSDRIVREVINAETKKSLVHISGYDLIFSFNLEYLKTVEDIDAACKGLSQLFRDMILEQLLEGNKQSE